MVHEFREAFDVNSFSENVTFPSGAPEFKPNLMKLANRSVKLSHRLQERQKFSTSILLVGC